MMKKRNKLVTLVAALAMLVTMLVATPATAFGDIPPLPGTDVCAVYVDGVSDAGYADIADAFAFAKFNPGTTIYLLEDIAGCSFIEINNSMAIDLRGFDLEFASGEGMYIHGTNAELTIVGGGRLTLDYLEIEYGSLEATADITAVNGITIYAAATLVVNGDITCTEANGLGAYYSHATVNGNISGIDYGICAHGENTEVLVNGDVTAVDCGIDASWQAVVTVNGDVQADVGIYTWKNGEDPGDIDIQVSVNGNVRAKDVGILAIFPSDIYVSGDVLVSDAAEGVGVAAYDGVKVTIDGMITARFYIIFADHDMNDVFVYLNDYDATTAKAGYRQYSDNLENASYVWVKAIFDPVSPPPKTPGTGDGWGLAALLAGLLSAFGACGLLARRKVLLSKGRIS